ncbi:MAG: hypothetical protein JNM34_11460 [Chthonomonadaceae bacterium]|jgi:hypothetical protein|nr:hypothetical protein [Chthonomonadaceae bacterium]
MVRERVFLGILGLGFLTLLFDVRFEHRYVVKDMWQGMVPVIYSAVAAGACALALFKNKACRTVSAVLFFAGLVVSIVGLYFHTKFEPEKFEKFLFPDKKVYYAKPDADGEKVEVELDEPLAAPLGFAGLSMIGFVVSSGLFKSSKSTS